MNTNKLFVQLEDGTLIPSTVSEIIEDFENVDKLAHQYIALSDECTMTMIRNEFSINGLRVFEEESYPPATFCCQFLIKLSELK